MKKSVIAALIFLFAMFGAVTCFAVEYVEDDMNNLVTKTQRYDTYLSSSYFENNKSETNISTQNGEFSYRQTDYSLPGRNGLDLKIERMYRGNMTSLYEIGTKFTGSKWINVIETEWSDDNYLSFYEKRYNLGTGLRFSFPTIEAVKTSENAKKYLYLHSESGDVYRMVGPKETNGTKEYKLVGYELDDIKLIEDDETNPRYNINGWKSKYIFIDRNGTKTYFSDKKAYTSKPEDYEGCILGIVDRYGNEIKFEYTELSYTVGQHTQDQHTQKNML